METLTEYAGFSIGDIVTIHRRPNTWSSTCNSKYPLRERFPMIGRINAIASNPGHDYISADINGFGFTMSKLVLEGNISPVSATKTSNEFPIFN